MKVICIYAISHIILIIAAYHTVMHEMSRMVSVFPFHKVVINSSEVNIIFLVNHISNNTVYAAVKKGEQQLSVFYVRIVSDTGLTYINIRSKVTINVMITDR